MAEELTLFYVVKLGGHWWLLKHYQCFLPRKPSRTCSGLGTRTHSRRSAVVEGFLRDHQFTERERKPEDTRLLGVPGGECSQ